MNHSLIDAKILTRNSAMRPAGTVNSGKIVIWVSGQDLSFINVLWNQRKIIFVPWKWVEKHGFYIKFSKLKKMLFS